MRASELMTLGFRLSAHHDLSSGDLDRLRGFFAGWHRVHAFERHLSRLDHSVVAQSSADLILICAAAEAVEQWPE